MNDQQGMLDKIKNILKNIFSLKWRLNETHGKSKVRHVKEQLGTFYEESVKNNEVEMTATEFSEPKIE
ncbi:hypothetical protein [Piscirickettsia litoralis]|uniref:hypothetical protein n=1 Tax=Piscirickettsia litoralis TaxID=1891921 RepID=UPI001112E5C1|nr:hypothetical protein [Piscirickettsia litoralis]